MFTSFGEPVDQQRMREQRLELYELPDYMPKKGKHNNYGYNESEQATETYTGMGFDINVHDQWAVESQGAIQDRTREVLASSDIGITEYRKSLIKSIGNLKNPKRNNFSRQEHELPVAIDVIAPIDNWEKSWLAADVDRRKNSSWINT